jgi:serine/threonine protein kinase
VQHLHNNGIVHRDIKLENLLYSPSPSYHLSASNPLTDVDGGIALVKLGDFGLAKEVFSASTATPCGTIGYTAPEIVLSQSYSKNVDIWALGCVLYTMLCGYPPFGGEAEEVTRNVARGGWEFGRPWWDHVGWEGGRSVAERAWSRDTDVRLVTAKDLISNALVLDPSRRFTIEQFLSHPWILPELARLGIPPTSNIPRSLGLPSAGGGGLIGGPGQAGQGQGGSWGWKVPGRLATPAEEKARMMWGDGASFGGFLRRRFIIPQF